MLSLLETIGKFIEKMKGAASEADTAIHSCEGIYWRSVASCKNSIFSEIAGRVDLFLKRYQTDDPMLPIVFNDLHDLFITTLRSMMMKEEYSERIHCTELTDEKFLNPGDMKLGLGVRNAFRKIP